MRYDGMTWYNTSKRTIPQVHPGLARKFTANYWRNMLKLAGFKSQCSQVLLQDHRTLDSKAYLGIIISIYFGHYSLVYNMISMLVERTCHLAQIIVLYYPSRPTLQWCWCKVYFWKPHSLLTWKHPIQTGETHGGAFSSKVASWLFQWWNGRVWIQEGQLHRCFWTILLDSGVLQFGGRMVVELDVFTGMIWGSQGNQSTLSCRSHRLLRLVSRQEPRNIKVLGNPAVIWPELTRPLQGWRDWGGVWNGNSMKLLQKAKLKQQVQKVIRFKVIALTLKCFRQF